MLRDHKEFKVFKVHQDLQDHKGFKVLKVY